MEKREYFHQMILEKFDVHMWEKKTQNTRHKAQNFHKNEHNEHKEVVVLNITAELLEENRGKLMWLSI